MGRYLVILDEIIREATTGMSNNSAYLPLLFNTKEMRYTKLIDLGIIEKHYPNLFEPTLIILDNKKFELALKEYIDKALSFYENDINLKKDKEPIKYLLYNTFSNILLSDFDDAKTYIDRITSYIGNERLNDYCIPNNIGYIDTLCGTLIIGVSKCNSSSLTPFSIQISIERVINNKIYYYDFPCVKYGIFKSTAYIYSVERVNERDLIEDLAKDEEYKKELKDYQETIKELLKKLIKTSEIDFEKIVSLTCAIALLSERGIDKIEVPTVLINRYNGIEISCYQNLSRLNKIYNEALEKNKTDILEETIAKIAAIKKTLKDHPLIVEKKNTQLIKNFKYLEEIFSDYKIYDYPMQQDTNLHFHVIPNGHECSSKILEELDEAIRNYESLGRSLKDY